MPCPRILVSFLVVTGLVFTRASAHAETPPDSDSNSDPDSSDSDSEPAASPASDTSDTSDAPVTVDMPDAPPPGECGSEADLSACLQCCAASHAEGLKTLYAATLGCLAKGGECVRSACSADSDCVDFQTCLDESQCAAKR